ncbi:hypothetical protein IAU59_000873 [Kwoniella sp. CBS 9459]
MSAHADETVESTAKTNITRHAHRTETTHAFHRQGDISFKSKDGVILWTDSRRLADASKVFKHMFDLPPPPPVINQNGKRPLSETGTSETHDGSHPHQATKIPAIDLDYESTVISVFLDLISVSVLFIPQSDFTVTRELYRLCDQYDVDKRIRGKVMAQLDMFGKMNPWALLVFAGQIDDVILARLALRHMDVYKFLGVHFPTAEGQVRAKNKQDWDRLSDFNHFRASGELWAEMGRLPPSWQVELLRSTLAVSGTVEEGGKPGLQLAPYLNWANVSAYFFPGVD